MKTALITGITGQDGGYLAELLLDKGYTVHGIKRRASSFNTTRIDHLYQDPHDQDPRLTLHYGDLTDSTNLIRIIEQVQPDEIYNLGAQSHVAVSFEAPEYTANSDALGTLRILEAARQLGLSQKTRINQASPSELYGLVRELAQKESTPFYPRSPYSGERLYAYWITVNYRETYGMHAWNGILFNHESPRHSETFVTRKIMLYLARIDTGLNDCLYMGNLDSQRDWGHIRDYMEMQWRMQQARDDFVIATERQELVRRFIELTTAEFGWGAIEWEGESKSEIGCRCTGDVVARIDPRYLRPAPGGGRHPARRSHKILQGSGLETKHHARPTCGRKGVARPQRNPQGTNSEAQGFSGGREPLMMPAATFDHYFGLSKGTRGDGEGDFALGRKGTAGRLQAEQIDEAWQYIRLAKHLEVSKKLLAWILAVGVYDGTEDTLAIAGGHPRARLSLHSAIFTSSPGSEAQLLAQAQMGQQYQQLGLLAVANGVVLNAVSSAPIFFKRTQQINRR